MLREPSRLLSVVLVLMLCRSRKDGRSGANQKLVQLFQSKIEVLDA